MRGMVETQLLARFSSVTEDNFLQIVRQGGLTCLFFHFCMVNYSGFAYCQGGSLLLA